MNIKLMIEIIKNLKISNILNILSVIIVLLLIYSSYLNLHSYSLTTYNFPNYLTNSLYILISIELILLIIYAIVIMTILLFTVNMIVKSYIIYKIKKYPTNKKSKIAIIFGHDNWKSLIVVSIFRTSGLFLLLKNLEKKGISFAIYIDISKKEFNEIIENKHHQILYLIGHGSKIKFKLNKKEVILYESYRNSNFTKNEINLYHCTMGEGKSIIDFLVKSKKGYIANRLFFSLADNIKIEK